MTKDEVLEAIKEMSVLDLADLVKSLEDTFGIKAIAPMAMPAMGAAMADGGGSGAAAVEEEEQTEFTVMLTEIGANKINVIKAVREVTTLGLREAKELVEGAPTQVKESVPKSEADSVKAKLEEAGATVAIQ
jgi:large subunit ribosomal protein L7/L12